MTTHESRRFSGDSLVRIYRVSPYDITPTPDKSVMGRLDNILRTVGSKGGLSVRARMITAVAGTKFKTTSGLPISLIGLHGKDELLVVGPPWALERLASGETPRKEPAEELVTMRQRIEYEIGFLSQLETLLKELNAMTSEQLDSAASCEPYNAKDKLCALFRCSPGPIRTYFETNDAAEFSSEMIAEAKALLNTLPMTGEEGEYPAWWSEWDGAGIPDPELRLITASGRHVSAYPVQIEEKRQTGRRNKDFARFFGPAAKPVVIAESSV